MKTIKGPYRDNNYFEYEVNGKKVLGTRRVALE